MARPPPGERVGVALSVKKIERKDGPRYLVEWKDELRRGHSKTFRKKADADAFDAKIKLARRTGELADLDAGKETLHTFHDEWRRLYAEHHLATKTLLEYDRYLKDDILPALGHHQLRRLTPKVIQQFAAKLADDGRGAATIRKILGILQGILERAIEWGRIQTNPTKAVKRPALTPSVATAYGPEQIEALRWQMPTTADATFISTQGYAGLRPGETLALRWGDIGKHAISVSKALSLGDEKTTKTRKNRSVPLLRPLAQDLNEWRLESGRPPHDALVFPAANGGPWQDHDYRNWRRRVFKPAASKAGIANARPYDLRHSYASLRFAEQTNPAEVAAELGDTLETTLNTYTHVITELAGQGPISAEAAIQQARRGNRAAQRSKQLRAAQGT